jgi:hypothetical protein
MKTSVTKPIGLKLTGPGGGEWTIAPAQDDGLVGVAQGIAGETAAVVTSTGPEFVIWATQRRPWRERDVKIEGDETYAASVLDAVNLF